MASGSSNFYRGGLLYQPGGGGDGSDNNDFGNGDARARGIQPVYQQQQQRSQLVGNQAEQYFDNSVPAGGAAAMYAGGGRPGSNIRILQRNNMNNMGIGNNGRREEPNADAPVVAYRYRYVARREGDYHGAGNNNSLEEPNLKTPIAFLNEICARPKVKPVFEFTEDGPPHAKTFICKVRVDYQETHLEATAQMNTKKDAKQEAARNILLQLDQNNTRGLARMLAPPKPEASQQQGSGSGTESSESIMLPDPDPEGNPVGDLNDLTLKLKLLTPKYEAVGEEGKSHQKVYTVACQVELGDAKITEHGIGRTKRVAKRIAAHKAFLKLNEATSEQSKGEVQVEKNDAEEDENGLIAMLDKMALSSNTKKKKKKTVSSSMPMPSSSSSVNDNWNLPEWLIGFKERPGEKWQSLQESKSTGDPVKLLRELAAEQNFNLQKVDLTQPEATDPSEQFVCFVSLKMEPVALFCGMGGSKTQARINAAKSALEFLTIAKQTEFNN